MINTSSVSFMSPQILTTLSGLSILQHDEHTYVLPIVTGMYLIKHTNQFFKLEWSQPQIHEQLSNQQYWYVIGWDTGGKKAIEYSIPRDTSYYLGKTIDHRRWLRGLPCNFPCTVIENMSEIFPKTAQMPVTDIHHRYQERVESEFKPRLKEIVAYHG